MAGSKSTQTRFVRDNCIYYTSLRLLFSIIMHLSCLLSALDLHVGDTTGCFCTPQKASVVMYSGCNYPYKSCLCTFWPCHPYFILQFYSIVFILVSVLFLLLSERNLSMPSQYNVMVCLFNSQWSINRRWDVMKFARACKIRSHAPHRRSSAWPIHSGLRKKLP